MGAFVSGLALTAVKATRLVAVPRIELGELGAQGDRAFCVIDERDRMLNGKQLGELQTATFTYDAPRGELSLTLPDGTGAGGQVQYGPAITIRFLSDRREARLVDGPWAQALSAFIGRPLRIVAPENGVDRGREGAVSIISRASVQRLADVAGQEEIDSRRFRMLIEVDGVDPHEEDSWVGRELQIGSARVLVQGNIGRCLVTSRDPESGTINLPTLDLLGTYRREVPATEPLPLGVHAEVLQGGSVAVGDAITGDIE